MQAPSWTEFLQCSVCTNRYDAKQVVPVSLSCGHTICRRCLGKLKTRVCPYDKAAINPDAESLPPNHALLSLLDQELDEGNTDLSNKLGLSEEALEQYRIAALAVKELVFFLQPFAEQGGATAMSGTHLTRPMLKKLVTVVNCQMLETEGRARALRAARSVADRTVTELLVLHQNQQQISTLLWTAVRNRGCQFLGPVMQEATLKLILKVLESGHFLSRKNIVLYAVQQLLEQEFPLASKTCVGHVVQLLYRASCFNVEKREEDSSLMQLKEEYRSYETLRREHDSQIIRVAMEAGLRISPEQWSTLLYGDHKHKSDMQSIIDKLIAQGATSSGLSELIVAIGRSQDPYNLSERIVPHLELLLKIEVNIDKNAELVGSWQTFAEVTKALLAALQGFTLFMQIQSGRYKTGLCPYFDRQEGCPKGTKCTYAHSEEEREKYRDLAKSNKTKPRPASMEIGSTKPSTAPVLRSGGIGATKSGGSMTSLQPRDARFSKEHGKADSPYSSMDSPLSSFDPYGQQPPPGYLHDGPPGAYVAERFSSGQSSARALSYPPYPVPAMDSHTPLTLHPHTAPARHVYPTGHQHTGFPTPPPPSHHHRHSGPLTAPEQIPMYDSRQMAVGSGGEGGVGGGPAGSSLTERYYRDAGDCISEEATYTYSPAYHPDIPGLGYHVEDGVAAPYSTALPTHQFSGEVMMVPSTLEGYLDKPNASAPSVADSIAGIRYIREQHETVNKLVKASTGQVPTPSAPGQGDTGSHPSAAVTITPVSGTPGTVPQGGSPPQSYTQGETVGPPQPDAGDEVVAPANHGLVPQTQPNSAAYGELAVMQRQLVALSVGEVEYHGQVQSISATQPKAQTVPTMAHAGTIPIPDHTIVVPVSVPTQLPYMTPPANQPYPYPHTGSAGSTGSVSSDPSTSLPAHAGQTTDQLKETIRVLQQQLLEKEVDEKMRQQQQSGMHRSNSVSRVAMGGISPKHTGVMYAMGGAGGGGGQRRHSGPQHSHTAYNVPMQHQGTPPQPRYSPRSTMQHYPTYQEGVEGVGGVYYQPQPTGYPHQWSGPMTAGGFPSPHGSLTSLHGTTPPGPGLMVPQAVAAPVMPQHPPPMQPNMGDAFVAQYAQVMQQQRVAQFSTPILYGHSTEQHFIPATHTYAVETGRNPIQHYNNVVYKY